MFSPWFPSLVSSSFLFFRKTFFVAQNVSFSPDFIAKLDNKARFIQTAAKAVSMFAKFPGPDGRYYARLVKILGSFDKKDQSLIVTAAYVIIASVETGDQKFANCTLRQRFQLRASENQTEDEAWARLFTDLFQSLGYATAGWTDPKAQMIEAVGNLNAARPPVVLNIAVNKKNANFHNVSVMEILNEKAIEQFVQPKIEVDEEAMQAEEPEAISGDFKAQYAEAETYLSSCDYEGCLAAAKSSGLDEPFPIDLPSFKVLLLRHYIESQGQNPDDYFPAPASTLPPSSASTEEPEEEEESAEEELSNEDRLNLLIDPIRHDRTALKKACVKFGITKFNTGMTNEVIANMLFSAARDKGLEGGKVPF